MKRLCVLAVLVLVLFAGFVGADEMNVIPKPVEVASKAGVFDISDDTVIVAGADLRGEAELLADYLSAAGLDVSIAGSAGGAASVIELKVAEEAGENEEGYTLIVDEDEIVIEGASAAGVFYGIQTLRQLLPAEVYGGGGEGVKWQVPCVRIEDEPSYPWRGMMLDVSRYFMDKDYVKRYMDMMAMHKLNVLQLHVVDDAGWRVEIEKYPKLTEVGAFRGKGADRSGGYYTKEDIREIVEYANRLHIEIVPEIEMPAHAMSALCAYPWLGCTGEQFEMPTKHWISREIMCAGRESTYEFVEDVLSEVVEMFPGRFVHIGGDEARYDRWKQCEHCRKRMEEEGLENYKQLQGYMTRRVEKFLMTKDRRLIGWDEILDCGLAPNATVMTWHRPATAVQAAKSGNNVVMALTGHAYFDTPESGLPGEPPAATWLPPISLKKAYQWEPAPKVLSEAEKKYILGGHGCLWTDQFLHKPFLQDMKVLAEKRSWRYVDYLTLPRMAALAEVVWTPEKLRGWEDFAARQSVQYGRYDGAGWHYRVPVPEVEKKRTADGYMITASSPVAGAEVRYTTDGRYPTPYSDVYGGPVKVDDPQKFAAITVVDRRHYSLAFQFPPDVSKQFAEFGEKLGEWESGKVSAGTYSPVKFDATGLINKAGVYEVTFMYTSGQQRLDIEKVEVIVNDKVVARDVHHGFTGGQRKANTYRLKIDDFETGANYFVRANVMGDTGDDSNGVVLIKLVE
ncbi:Beta-N-acetylhexosaminidase [Anaerohalosphaera lusitana]|uniref:beta-N-acetylhexosaminidase n=1 Tax=Anaerohalosphaera lusitana TaxID=1936003 RepID=A0A1U9NGJ0_9BACT|nr:family 20 glycosylhydrolase [Anaerohalosphaera lusitana]AQT67053.1 Beta-N-acetylhexosaminidase [Anaerohalosphaera lusitana]